MPSTTLTNIPMVFSTAPGVEGGGIGNVGNTGFVGVSPTATPGGEAYSDILNRLYGRLPGAPPDFQALLQAGVASPLLQTVLQPALANLLPGEELARQQLMDQFRSAGALGSGAQGVASSRLENALQGQRANLISSIISQMLPTMVQGLSQQYQNQLAVPGLLGSLLQSAKPQIVTSQPGQGIGSVGGGRGGGGGYGGSSDFGTPAFWSENDPYFQAALAAAQPSPAAPYPQPQQPAYDSFYDFPLPSFYPQGGRWDFGGAAPSGGTGGAGYITPAWASGFDAWDFGNF
jgi:hypothetical protein